VDGQWRGLDKRTEVINVAGGEPVTITVRTSKHGPLLSDASEDLRELGGSNAIALRWTALDPGRTVEAIFAINRARDWEQGRAAAALFEVPAQNIVYADVDGNIGYQSPGRVPVRGKGDGRWMAPGWDSGYDWQGWVPFAELPSVRNPERGFVVTANQAVIGANYAHLLTNDWSYGYRSQRIYDLLDATLAGGGKVSMDDVARMQFDNRNGMAATIVPRLMGLELTGAAHEARELLRTWDFQQPADGPAGSVDARRSAAAAYYNAFWRHLLSSVFDELPDDYRPDGGDRWFEVVRALFGDGTSAWWDDRRTPERETPQTVVSGALVAAAEELRAAQGADPAGWRWGRMHRLSLESQTFGQSGIGPIEWLFNRGPAGVAGGDAIVNATGWDAADGYEVDAVPSMRMIVDMSSLDSSRWIQLTGNSGHPYHPHYTDQFELWRTGRYLPMRWDRVTIGREAVHTQTLTPR
jgi:penicillin amidase